MKVLVANRGAIAVRICRTLSRMGVASVVVFTNADVDSEHVAAGDEAVNLGADPKAYLDGMLLVQTAKTVNAEAIHPGYGFLSENADFAELCGEHGIKFIGPTPEQMRQFGLKHRARALALSQNVPLCQGSELLEDVEHAKDEAARIGYPVMLKSTGGGGGIGMRPAKNEAELVAAFESVKRTASSSFKDAGVFVESFIEHARHIEVQVFGDGQRVEALGERDCSTQRRNQKVIEECPAPNLPEATRAALHKAAKALTSSVGYCNAGTVEFIVDADDPTRYFFLEVNTRLQVEHGVTEQVLGIDLVEWMVKLGALGTFSFPSPMPAPKGWSMQARIYAEDPNKDFQPNTGILTLAEFPSPSVARVETWVVSGTPVSPFYDPMLAKIIVTSETRLGALVALQQALARTRLCGLETNVEYLQHIVSTPELKEGRMTTRFLSTFTYVAQTLDVIESGTQTSVQDWPGRLGYWSIGVPPSGPMDALALRTANRIVGNDDKSAGLEVTIVGPTLRFNCPAVIAVTGADLQPELNGAALTMYAAASVSPGDVLRFKGLRGAGCRCYIGFGGGGLDVPEYMGSKSTFALGNFGGHAGRCLRAGDVLKLPSSPRWAPKQAPATLVPTLSREVRIAVLLGPQPDFLLPDFVEEDLFQANAWKVHFNSNRLGIRLTGPSPRWARRDGGDGGLHPSNIHDNEYAIGSVNFTGDTPVILGLDGPSLGGFICPITLVKADLWKVGQLMPGDHVTFVRQTFANAVEAERRIDCALEALLLDKPVGDLLDLTASPLPGHFDAARGDGFMLAQRAETDQGRPAIFIRQAGDYHVLIEYGPQELDLVMRFRVHALSEALENTRVQGVDELSPGVRSLQVRFSASSISLESLVSLIMDLDSNLPQAKDMRVPSRIVHLPLAFDCSTTKKALDTYRRTVRSDAPWLPSNVEFIRRINGLDSLDAVSSTIFNAVYMVLGLGDVYLGAPCAVPLDPRTRLVTTKFNPARTWTAEGEVGIGGVYMCIYGMESPGGYQLVGRTVPVWSSYRRTACFDKPWLLRFFDQVRFFPVDEDALNAFRSNFRRGKAAVKIESVSFSVGDYLASLERDKPAIEAFRASQRVAFEAEVERWNSLPSMQASAASSAAAAAAAAKKDVKHTKGSTKVQSHVSGVVWNVACQVGDVVAKGQTLVVVQAMKMELSVVAPRAGRVLDILVSSATSVESGDAVLELGPLPMDIVALQSAYKAGILTPAQVVDYLYDDAPEDLVQGSQFAYIHRALKSAVLDRIAQTSPAQPLYGVFYASKDNIDVAGMPTTAACPAYSRTPARSAKAVELLDAAGAVCLGKTNMDQFALGLVGVRSPYGACKCVFNEEFISGGSSSGSSVLVALGLCSFSLGTDTAGSGRVPAALNGIVGYKPSRGLLSCRGVLPACQSLDCVSVFATSCADCAAVQRVVAHFDAEDPFSRRGLPRPPVAALRRLGIPSVVDVDASNQVCWTRSTQLLGTVFPGVEFVYVSVAALVDAARLLYGGPFVAERRAPLLDFLRSNGNDVHSVTKTILDGAAEHTAESLYVAVVELMRLKRRAELEVWNQVDALVLPTAPSAFTIAQVQADPFALNSVLGRYTNFVNLLDLAAVAVPTDRRPDGVGFGISLIAPAGSDGLLLEWSALVHAATNLGAGVTTSVVPPTAPDAGQPDDDALLVVAGAHMRGMALNSQIVQCGGAFVKEATTAKVYRMFALPDGRPGLVKEPAAGVALAVEVWRLPLRGLGAFLSQHVVAPLCLGTVDLEGGEAVKGFLCEAWATKQASDVSGHGGWRAYQAWRSSQAQQQPLKRKQEDAL